MARERQNSTLEELDGERWGAPTFPSRLVRTCHALRRKPLRTFTVEDFRVMIGQGFSLDVLLPRALTLLETDPLAEGDYYPGDLLVTVLGPRARAWIDENAPALRTQLVAIAQRAKAAHLGTEDWEGPLADAVEDLLTTAP